MSEAPPDLPGPPPEPRFFSLNVLFVLRTFSDTLTPEQILAAVEEQIILPLTVNTGEPYEFIEVLGSAQSSITEMADTPVMAAFGREATPEPAAA